MKISWNWLNELLETGLSREEAAEMLTACGLEVEAVELYESVKGGLKGLVVGQVMECGKHPDADRLSLTKVDIGSGELLSIVCGAPNVAAGQKVIVATVGATLYPVKGEAFSIKKSKIRGAASEGMICAEDEIGWGESHAGIMVLPDEIAAGTPASRYFNIEQDFVFEIGLTPNRSDAASHLGVARDLAALLNFKLTALPKKEIRLSGLNPLPDPSGLESIAITIDSTAGCKRYSGLVISGISVGESPQWLKNRLQAIGLRPINNIVDITNYVLHELGQPLHAFDTAEISGKEIVVREAREGEQFTTLDGVERILKSGDLMVCNKTVPMCIAGVFGGISSGVTSGTTSVFIESAYFDPAHVRRSAKNHGLKTDASFRFERGCDPAMTVVALQRAANLILELAGGTVSMGITDIYPEKLEPYKVAFSYKNCNALIGKEIERGVIRSILLNLGIEIETEGNDGLLLKVPRFKTDVTREADVVEEVLRIYGYNQVEAGKTISYTAFNQMPNLSPALENKIGALLEGLGFSEMMGLSLSRENDYDHPEDLVKIMNPLSQDLNVLRGSLLFGGLESIAYNINRKNQDLKLYEFGQVYQLQNGEKVTYRETKQLSLMVTGRLYAQNHYGLNQEADVFFLKSTVSQVLNKCGATYTVKEGTHSQLDQVLVFEWKQQVVAELGKVKKTLLKQAGIEQEVYFAHINLRVLLSAFSWHSITYQEPARFPAVRRDLALLIDKAVSYQQIEDLAYSTEKKWLKEVNLFDVYESEKLGGKKSYAVSFTLQNNEATLTDKQIETVMDKLVKNYKEKLGAELR